MKKTIYTLALTTFIVGSVLVGCQTSTKKELEAKDKVTDAQREVRDAKEELIEAKKEATAEEWQTFKNETAAKVNENENKIAELKAKMKKTGNSIDAIYAKKIEELEQKNKDIEVKVETYKNDRSSDWESFKREYNHDMTELGQALKDMTIDNKN
jgi:flagellar biosynthesis GTPase FlhF